MKISAIPLIYSRITAKELHVPTRLYKLVSKEKFYFHMKVIKDKEVGAATLSFRIKQIKRNK